MIKASVKKNVLRIRLARDGRRHHPIYRINIAHLGWRRDGRHIENVGKYEPIPDPKDGMKHVQLNFERIKFWLGKGAIPSPTVAWLLGKASLLPSVPRGRSVLPNVYLNTSRIETTSVPSE